MSWIRFKPNLNDRNGRKKEHFNIKNTKKNSLMTEKMPLYS